MSSTGSTVNGMVVSVYGDSWYLDITGIVSQCIQIMNHYDIHLKLIGYCMSIMLQLKKK